MTGRGALGREVAANMETMTAGRIGGISLDPAVRDAALPDQGEALAGHRIPGLPENDSTIAIVTGQCTSKPNLSRLLGGSWSRGAPKLPRYFLRNQLVNVLWDKKRQISVDPRMLTHAVDFLRSRPVEISVAERKALYGEGRKNFLVRGPMEPFLRPFKDHPKSKMVRELLDLDLNYRETNCYADMADKARSGQTDRLHKRLSPTVKDVDEYFQYVCGLIDSIRKDGVKSRNASASDDGPKFTHLNRHEHDIGCIIGPQGQLWHFWTGHHRLAIAVALGLPEVPVRIHCMHWQWLARNWARPSRVMSF